MISDAVDFGVTDSGGWDTSGIATAQQRAVWTDAIGMFERQETDFRNAYNDLIARYAQMQAAPAALRDEYNSLLSRAQSTLTNLDYIKASLQDVKNALVGAWNSVSNAWSGVASTVKGFFGLSGWDGLGFIPLIPIAVVTASIAAMAYFLNDYAQFQGKLAEMDRLRASGASAQQASDIVAKTFGGGTGITGFLQSSFGKVALIAGIGLIIVAIPMFAKGRK